MIGLGRDKDRQVEASASYGTYPVYIVINIEEICQYEPLPRMLSVKQHSHY